MPELIVTIVCLWLFFKCLGLTLRLTWGVTKFVVSLLFAVALPLLGFCLLFAGGLVILIPLGILVLAFVLLKAIIHP